MGDGGDGFLRTSAHALSTHRFFKRVSKRHAGIALGRDCVRYVLVFLRQGSLQSGVDFRELQGDFFALSGIHRFFLFRPCSAAAQDMFFLLLRGGMRSEPGFAPLAQFAPIPIHQQPALALQPVPDEFKGIPLTREGRWISIHTL